MSLTTAVKKTNLAKRMRAWMRSRTGSVGERRFFSRELYVALGIPEGYERQKVRNALTDFLLRGEVTFRFNRKRKRRHYLYNQTWRRALKGRINRKIFKAMYVSSSFAVTDIVRLVGIKKQKDRNWADKIVRRMVKEGYLQQVARRLCAHGSGAEKVYRVVDRDRFNLELMK
ncbi:MAG: hypothetical protein ABSC54_00685 [Smithellaceae bacterium]|jgi:hypothetical protein